MSFIKSSDFPLLIILLVLIITSSCKRNKDKTKSINKNLVSIQINPAKTYQTINGFGASDAWRTQFVGKNWPLDKRKKIADLLFSKKVDRSGNPKGIGLSIWRFYIGAGSKEQGEESGIANEWRRAPSFLDANGEWDWSKYKGQRWFLKAAQKRGVNQFLAFTISPPVFMTKNGKAFSPGGRQMNIKKDKLDDYADYLVNIISHFQNQEGITFDYLSPINEPQWNWDTGKQEGTPATNPEIHDFVKLLSRRLSDRGLPTRITLGEAGQLKFLSGETKLHERDNQINALLNPSSKQYIGGYPNVKPIISGHSYFSVWPPETLIAERKKLSSRLREVAPKWGYWESEYCILQNNDDITGGQNRDLGINTALYVARIMHYDLTVTNAKSWQWWTALTQFDFKDGLIYLDDGGDGVDDIDDPQMESLKYNGNIHDSKLLWALGNYSRFVRPGMKRIEVENKLNLEEQATDLMASAYIDKNGDKIVIVFVNYSENEKPVRLDVSGNIGMEQQLDTYTTSSTIDLKKQVINKNALVIPPRSIVTVISNIQ